MPDDWLPYMIGNGLPLWQPIYGISNWICIISGEIIFIYTISVIFIVLSIIVWFGVPVSACLPACLPVRLSQILSSETKLYSPNLCLGISIVGHVVVWFVCQFFMSWSGIPHSFHKILLLWWKTTGLAPHIKCQPVCLFMSFILRKFYDQSCHFCCWNAEANDKSSMSAY